MINHSFANDTERYSHGEADLEEDDDRLPGHIAAPVIGLLSIIPWFGVGLLAWAVR